MKIIQANQTNRQSIIELLKNEKLPVDDLPGNLDHFFVAVSDSNIIGVIGLELYPPFCLLRSMVVRKDYQNQKVATALVETLEKHAFDLKLSRIYLLTETASAYFDKKNYQRVERSEVPDEIKGSTEFSSVCPVSAIVMKKSI
ncbi:MULTISPECIES: arsenic resistance N-acetyltransferase ArsN2 [Niastella]|uniref:GNAT family N-acetyltransferase n=1 Tax=Niastella soli TaxID=2821487 RepID=A0ABS3Z447_9BACT|nr:arsenic resistance N-acetyltransferase ArsN2 [Niastella soli]MBO9204933.1 GNAT family N-acetyltransferase [Niastella soli]